MGNWTKEEGSGSITQSTSGLRFAKAFLGRIPRLRNDQFQVGQRGSIRLLWDPLLAPVQLPIEHVLGRLITGPAATRCFWFVVLNRNRSHPGHSPLLSEAVSTASRARVASDGTRLSTQLMARCEGLCLIQG